MAELIDESILHCVLVHADAESVYDALTTADGLNGWFTAGSTVEARPGGEIRLRWKDWGPNRITAEDGGPVLDARRPERFVFQWHPDKPDYATTVEITLEQPGAGTIVHLREHGYEDTPEGRRKMLECAAGWGEALTLMKFYVEHGVRY